VWQPVTENPKDTRQAIAAMRFKLFFLTVGSRDSTIPFDYFSTGSDLRRISGEAGRLAPYQEVETTYA
jgi:hypothetical protein